MKPKINFGDFVKQVSKDTTYAQKDIAAVLNSAAKIVLQNLDDGKQTVVFPGMIIYPSVYNNEIRFPRARFGKFFKSLSPIS